MRPGFLVKLKPDGPWRIGPDTGDAHRTGQILHSDAVYSALTHAMARLGELDAWLAATAASPGGPEVCFSSCYPFHRDTLLVVPPRGVWPPPPSAKLRYQSVRFVPLSFIEGLFSDQPVDEDRWLIDGPSECLLPSGKGPGAGPFRVTLRSHAAVDRLIPGQVHTHSTACLEFAEGAGLWLAVEFQNEDASERWGAPVRAALRLLADSGIGGRRSLGWGRAQMPEITEGSLPGLIWSPKEDSAASEHAWWLLSLFAPAETDEVDWRRGSYTTLTRSGRIESSANWGGLKVPLPMIAEGSVVVAPAEPRGSARDIAPPGFPHPVYRSGFAVSIPIPWRASA